MCLIRFGARDLGLSHRQFKKSDAPGKALLETPTPPKRAAIWYHEVKLAPD